MNQAFRTYVAYAQGVGSGLYGYTPNQNPFAPGDEHRAWEFGRAEGEKMKRAKEISQPT